jgi:hypothetical protein
MMEFFIVYIDVVRPFAETSPPEPNDKIFLRADGEPDKRLGDTVSIYFKHQHDKNYCTTTIRAVIQTRAITLHDQGKINVSLIYSCVICMS